MSAEEVHNSIPPPPSPVDSEGRENMGRTFVPRTREEKNTSAFSRAPMLRVFIKN